MAVDYTKAKELAQNRSLLSRVQACMVETALEVLAEDPATANHAERAVYAKAILNGEAEVSAQVMLSVTTNATLLAGVTHESPSSDAASAEVSDGDIEFQIAAVWNALAGVG